MMSEFWKPHYGAARKVAWRRVKHLLICVVAMVVSLNVLQDAPKFVFGIVLLVGIGAVAVFFTRYLMAEADAFEAAILDEEKSMTHDHKH
jgi:hypothetical protein